MPKQRNRKASLPFIVRFQNHLCCDTLVAALSAAGFDIRGAHVRASFVSDSLDIQLTTRPHALAALNAITQWERLIIGEKPISVVGLEKEKQHDTDVVTPPRDVNKRISTLEEITNNVSMAFNLPAEDGGIEAGDQVAGAFSGPENDQVEGKEDRQDEEDMEDSPGIESPKPEASGVNAQLLIVIPETPEPLEPDDLLFNVVMYEFTRVSLRSPSPS